VKRKMNWTPGPWAIIRNSWEVSSVYDSSGGVVAECRINCAVSKETAPGFEANKDANAHLIAAAPELYAALQSLYDAYKRVEDTDITTSRDDCDSVINQLIDAERGALAALAKARGETP
jgi:hypothetical protein